MHPVKESCIMLKECLLEASTQTHQLFDFLILEEIASLMTEDRVVVIL